MILLLNGAFGVGETTVARAVVARLPRAVVFDPEIIGIALQRLARAAGRRVDEFQERLAGASGRGHSFVLLSVPSDTSG
jgi:hypothetical protein